MTQVQIKVGHAVYAHKLDKLEKYVFQFTSELGPGTGVCTHGPSYS